MGTGNLLGKPKVNLCMYTDFTLLLIKGKVSTGSQLLTRPRVHGGCLGGMSPIKHKDVVPTTYLSQQLYNEPVTT